jgi:DNA polymerase III epsilon subunit-like protein
MMPIPERVVKVHGINDDKVAAAPPFSAVADQIKEFLCGALVVMHRSGFDGPFLDMEFKRAGRPTLDQIGTNLIDSVSIVQSVYPLWPRHNLDALCNNLGVSLKDRALHGALTDVKLLAAALPKIAGEYDAWMAIVEDACAVQLDTFDKDINLLGEHLSGVAEYRSTEQLDENFARVATAQKWVEKQIDIATDRCRESIGSNNWCCKHFSARWDENEKTSWKDACNALIPSIDMSVYQSASLSHTVTGKVMEEIITMFLPFESVLSSTEVFASTHCTVRAIVILSKIKKELEKIRGSLREDLLMAKAAGYMPHFSAIRSSNRTTTNYEQAIQDHAPGADCEEYVLRSSSLKLRGRESDGCKALFS